MPSPASLPAAPDLTVTPAQSAHQEILNDRAKNVSEVVTKILADTGSTLAGALPRGWARKPPPKQVSKDVLRKRQAWIIQFYDNSKAVNSRPCEYAAAKAMPAEFPCDDNFRMTPAQLKTAFAKLTKERKKVQPGHPSESLIALIHEDAEKCLTAQEDYLLIEDDDNLEQEDFTKAADCDETLFPAINHPLNAHQVITTDADALPPILPPAPPPTPVPQHPIDIPTLNAHQVTAEDTKELPPAALAYTQGTAMGANKLLPASPTASAAPYPMDKPPQSVQEAPGSDANKLPPVLPASPPAPAVPHPTINPRLNANQVPGGDVNELLVPTPSAPAAPPLTSTHPLSAQ
ncbi:hypothetical protein CYMTET_20984, partial [Cymbomonas tetramitiformis]